MINKLNLDKAAFYKYLKIFIIGTFIVLVAVQAGKSFVLDEIDFPAVANSTSQSGKPIYYRGEVIPFEVGTYHPTLYINCLAAFIKIFGYSETSVRFFGVLCVLTSSFILILIIRRLIDKNNMIETLFLALYLLNPYTIANATLPDIDSTVLPVVMMLFIYLSLRYLLQNKDMSNKIVWILGSLFGLALWSKLTTPLIIPLFLACLAIITSKDYKKSLLFTLKVSFIGAIGFVLTYYLYCKALGLSTTYTYHFLVDSFAKGTKTTGPITGAINNLKYIKSFIYWPTIPIVGLLGVSFLGVMLDKNKDEKTKIKKLIVLIGLLVTFFYLALISPFGGFFKYPFPVFGLSILTIIFFYDRYLRRIKIKNIYLFLSLALGFIAEIKFWKDSMFYAGNRPFEYLTILSLAMVIAYIFVLKDIKNIASKLLILLIFFAIGFQLSISRIQAVSNYSTKYNYGKTGIYQTAAWLKMNTAPNEPIWAMKDVGYYVHDRYYESYAYYFSEPLNNNLVQMLKIGKVRYYVVSTGIGEDNIVYYPNIKQILNTYAVKQYQFGNYIIYKSKEAIINDKQ